MHKIQVVQNHLKTHDPKYRYQLKLLPMTQNVVLALNIAPNPKLAPNQPPPQPYISLTTQNSAPPPRILPPTQIFAPQPVD